jgi:lipopolysaccharide biosynthesis glycosyltransferase
MNKGDFEAVPRLRHSGRPVRTIAFSADDNYAAPCGVAIASLLQTISVDIFCDVVVLDNGLSQKNRQRLLALARDPERISIRFCNVAQLLLDAPVHGSFSKAAYLSIFIPYLFCEYEKVLCLDCDIIVQQDLSGLFETEFEGEYIAATRDIGMAENTRGRAPMIFQGRCISWSHYTRRYLGFTEDKIEDAINSGVLLFNIPAFIADDFVALRDVERHVRFGYFLVDQCVINILFRGRIKHIHLRWNLQVQHWGSPRLVDWFFQQYHEANENPAIIHYITPRKPWRTFAVPYEEHFWRVARDTDWFHELQEQRLSEGFFRWLNHSTLIPHLHRVETPLFSIIMPVFNRADSVARSIRSIQLQDFRDFEIIVIDDASTDHTVEVIRGLAQTDARIKLIRQEVNRGPGVARNVGVRQARGKYVGICDSDDFLVPGALAIYARLVGDTDFDVVAGNQFRWIKSQRKAVNDAGPSRIDRDFKTTELMEIPEFWTFVHFHRCVIRREFLIEHKVEYPALRRVEDPAYLAEVYTKADSFVIIKDPVYLYHVCYRAYQLTYEEVRDAYVGYELIRKTTTAAGYEEIAFFFPFFLFSVLVGSHERNRGRILEVVRSINRFGKTDSA